MSPQEAADAIGLHVNTVYKLVAEGNIPAIRLSRKILISRLELERWLSNRSPENK